MQRCKHTTVKGRRCKRRIGSHGDTICFQHMAIKSRAKNDEQTCDHLRSLRLWPPANEQQTERRVRNEIRDMLSRFHSAKYIDEQKRAINLIFEKMLDQDFKSFCQQNHAFKCVLVDKYHEFAKESFFDHERFKAVLTY